MPPLNPATTAGGPISPTEGDAAGTPVLLALDTSTPAAALALIDGPRGVHTARSDPDARHGRTLIPVLQGLLARAGRGVGELDALAVGLGPGSYTGLRVGVTAAKTLAYALSKPLVTFDSLDLVARNAGPEPLSVAVIADAQRGDVYEAAYTRDRPGGPLVRLRPTRITSFDAWAEALKPGTLVLGPAATLPKFAGSLPVQAVLPDDPARHWPDPDTLAGLALEAWRSGDRADVWFLEPVYLRRSAAEDQWERLGRPL